MSRTKTVTFMIFALLLQAVYTAHAFLAPKNSVNSLVPCLCSDGDYIDAKQLLAKAKAIRESIPPGATKEEESIFEKKPTEFSLPSELSLSGCTYRLEVDIGREPSTWMDPRWGASGRRIEFTLDVSFSLPENMKDGNYEVSRASNEIATGLIKSVTSKSNSVSKVYSMCHAPYARLKSGFDKMAIRSGGFCIETNPSARGSSTLRFCLSVEGTSNNAYGDVSIPEGNLYFAVPYFGVRKNESNGKAMMLLSTKEGTVTVKQMGWHRMAHRMATRRESNSWSISSCTYSR